MLLLTLCSLPCHEPVFYCLCWRLGMLSLYLLMVAFYRMFSCMSYFAQYLVSKINSWAFAYVIIPKRYTEIQCTTHALYFLLLLPVQVLTSELAVWWILKHMTSDSYNSNDITGCTFSFIGHNTMLSGGCTNAWYYQDEDEDFLRNLMASTDYSLHVVAQWNAVVERLKGVSFVGLLFLLCSHFLYCVLISSSTWTTVQLEQRLHNDFI